MPGVPGITHYNWRVVPFNGCGDGPVGVTRSGTLTGLPQQAVTLVYPENGYNVCAGVPRTFSWNPGTQPVGTQYRVEWVAFDDAPPPQGSWNTIPTSGTSVQITMPGVSGLTHYSWRVVPFNDCGDGPAGETRSGTLTELPTQAVTLTAPGDNDIIHSGVPYRFTWSTGTQPVGTRYRLSWRDHAGVPWQSVETSESFYDLTLTGNGYSDYFWKVTPFNDCGDGPDSETRTVRVGILVLEDLSDLACGSIEEYHFEMLVHPLPYADGMQVTVAWFVYRIVPDGQVPGQWTSVEPERIDELDPHRKVSLNLEEAGPGGYVEYIWWGVNALNGYGTSPVGANIVNPASGPTHVLYYDMVAGRVMPCEERYAVEGFPETIECDTRLVILPHPEEPNAWGFPEYTFDCSDLAIIGTETLPIYVTSAGVNLTVDLGANIQARYCTFVEAAGMLICSQTQSPFSYFRNCAFHNSAAAEAALMIIEGDVQIESCGFNNTGGNGIYLYDAGVTEIIYCDISGNGASGIVATGDCHSVDFRCCKLGGNGGLDYPEIMDEGSNLDLSNSAWNRFDDIGGILYYLIGPADELKFYEGRNTFSLNGEGWHIAGFNCVEQEHTLDVTNNFWSPGPDGTFDPSECYVSTNVLPNSEECTPLLLLSAGPRPNDETLAAIAAEADGLQRQDKHHGLYAKSGSVVRDLGQIVAQRLQLKEMAKSGDPQRAIDGLEELMASSRSSSDVAAIATDAAYAYFRHYEAGVSVRNANLRVRSLSEFGRFAVASALDLYEADIQSQSQSVLEIPTSYSLYQNYPNPFNPTTVIRFDLPENANVEVNIFNTLGQLVTTLLNEERAAGAYNVAWDARSSSGVEVAAGLYIYQIKAGSFTDSKKMLLLK